MRGSPIWVGYGSVGVLALYDPVVYESPSPNFTSTFLNYC
jgi:hypothetical protein